MLRIEKLTYRVGPRVLFDEAEATVNTGHRVGLIGRNGSGKTTLLRMIDGSLEAHEGRIHVPRRWRVGITSQEAPSGTQNLISTVLAADRELAELQAEAEIATDPHRIAEIHLRLQEKHAHSAEARAARLLAGLGFNEAAQQRACDEFSGGWRMRVALAGLLFTEPDLLLLDEPTNHLDLEAALWLEDYLRDYPGTVILVSHDRGLLNRAVDEILHLEGGKLTRYQGGYDRFEEVRRMQAEVNAKLRVRQETQRQHIRSFVERFRYTASKARQAQSRLKMLDRLQPIPELREEEPITFAFPDPEPLASPLYSAEAVSLGYDGRPVLRDLSFRLDADDRIGLLGANGNGKSTLLKLLAGRLAPLAGEIRKSSKLRIGYFAQHQAEELDLEANPVLALSRRRPRDVETQLRAHLGRFGFSQERAETKIANLSGGEKARLLFALMSAERPHILLLDEPTNHLDILSRQALVQALNGFAGTTVIVSHDPHVLALTADRLWLVDGGRSVPFDGDLDEYRTLCASGSGSATAKPAGNDRGTPSKKEARRLSAERRNALAPLRRQVLEAEAMVARLEAEKTNMRDALADPALYQGDGRRAADLRRQYAQLEKSIATAEETWFSRQQAFEEAEAELSQGD
ncbi:ABC-F family ATP-binding cassette domain-containing protein [Defluviicoccus vanus]|uniref:ABC-F family ATP-binding cassette domain-containing protein n=1 Tax=Defluviicoccus vanus TaxID=111831 RepID=A0A7H1N5J1_9PROT|nr:ABC-F family ATP-binding cassette domain-containing protein [Defluviicoccus vanus]QNT70977.1 ABC-F family ATP-binding cassette domain-containing protein [Defluviicoccus vanus]